MIYILSAALFFMLITSLVLARNRFEFKSINAPGKRITSYTPKVSICIPARNEENVIQRCVESVLNQDYDNFEVCVLDDNSEDKTLSILNNLELTTNKLSVIHGSPKPDDWLGKPWACHQLANKSDGEILIFVDADVWMEPFVISKTVANLHKRDALTIWPEQKLDGFIEKLVIPTIMFTLTTLLPAVYTERPPRWMPNFIYKNFKSDFVAACGQFFAIQKATYKAINGHEAVKNQVVEDVELGRILREKDFSLVMKTGVSAVYCKMYDSASEVWSGFQKNFYPGFGNLFTFIFAAIIHFLFFLFPFYTLFYSFFTDDIQITLISLSIVCLFTVQRLALNFWYKLDWWMAFMHPFAVLWFQVLGIKSLMNKILGIKTTWKGRPV